MADSGSADLTALAVQMEGLDLEENEAGSGAYGVAYKVTVGGRECIAKKLHTVLLQADNYYSDATTQQREHIVEKFHEECRILSSLNHPNVVSFVGVHYGRDRNDISLVMERLHTDLAAFVKENPDSPLPQRIRILYDVSKGLHYLHSHTPPLIHRDLTAPNILLTESLTAKIADLGMSRYLDPSMAERIKLPSHIVYMPPESKVKTPTYTTKLDIFSLGNLILHTINGKLPTVCDLSLESTDQLSPEGRVELTRRSDSVQELGEQHCLYPLVVQCLHDQSNRRPAIEGVTSYLRELNKELLRVMFLDACMKGHVERVRSLLKYKPDINELDDQYESTVLHLATHNGHLGVVQVLVEEANAEVNVKNTKGITAVYLAACMGHLKILEVLVQANADINIKNNDHDTALHLTSMRGYDEAVRALLAAKATVNTQNKIGWTPLMLACLNGHQKVVELLVGAGAIVNTQNKDGITALHLAAQEGHWKIVEILVQANADVNIKNNSHEVPLHFASDNGYDEVVRVLLAAKATVNTHAEDGKSPLMCASFRGHLNIVVVLIGAGATVNDQMKDGITALHAAAQEGHLLIVESLVEANADVNIKNNDHDTALHFASMRGHDEVARALLAAKATVNTRTETGKSPLMCASYFGHQKVAELLIQAGATVNIQEEDGSTALHEAAGNGHLSIVELLVDADADINIKNKFNQTPLMLAALLGHAPIVKTLLSQKS